jgi:uncharacterized protein YcfJ
MKKLLALQLVAIYAVCLVATVNIAHAEPEKKKVCHVDDKTKKEVCKTIKVHKKLEGTAVPEKDKKK